MISEISYDNPNDFSEFIEHYCIETNQCYIDAILEYCADNYVDPLDVKGLIHPALKEKIRAEAIENGLMKSIGMLDF